MEEFSGTAGPWTKNQYGEAVDPHGEIIHIWGVALSNGGEAKANANLVIAAPELLDALQDALHAYDKHSEHSEWDFARAAIAKALGK